MATLGGRHEPVGGVSDAAFDPTAPQVMYAAGRFSGVYRSSAGGATWTPINVGLPTRAVNALAIPADGQHLCRRRLQTPRVKASPAWT